MASGAANLRAYEAPAPGRGPSLVLLPRATGCADRKGRSEGKKKPGARARPGVSTPRRTWRGASRRGPGRHRHTGVRDTPGSRREATVREHGYRLPLPLPGCARAVRTETWGGSRLRAAPGPPAWPARPQPSTRAPPSPRSKRRCPCPGSWPPAIFLRSTQTSVHDHDHDQYLCLEIAMGLDSPHGISLLGDTEVSSPKGM